MTKKELTYDLLMQLHWTLGVNTPEAEEDQRRIVAKLLEMYQKDSND